MSRFHKKSLAILPLLSILSISPAELEIKNHVRGPASAVVEDIGKMNPALEMRAAPPEVVEDEGKMNPALEMRAAPPEVVEDKKEEKKIEFPKYEALVSKVDKDSLLKDEKLDKEKFLVKEEKLKEKIAEAKRNSPQDQESIEKLVIELLIVEADLKSLKEKELIKLEEEEKASLLALADHKKVIEEILVNLEKSDIQIAEDKEVKDEEVIVAEEKKEDKKEDKKEEAPVVTEDKTDKPEKPVVVKSEETCEADEKYDVLSKQMEKLIADQSQIMMAMVNMTQTMMQMMQQQMQQMQSFQMPNMASIYQYQPQTTAGNWVYHPSGFQPGQTNIFAPQPAQQQPQGYFPEQSHMAQQQPQQQMGPQSNWNIAPQMSFQNNPAYAPMQVNPGNFGGLSFNLEQPTEAPQLPMPTLTMI
jgi:hypothetical protein